MHRFVGATRNFAAALSVIGLLVAASGASAQPFPNKPVRIVVPFPAGSATDTIARTLAVPVSASIGQPVVVENKAGADGAISGTEVARAAPDGYTLLLATNSPLSAVPVAELLQYGKANPDKLNYATGNTTGIVSMALFNALGAVKMSHVPYKGEPQALVDLIAGRVQVMVVSSGTSLPHIREGKLRALAVTLTQRSPALPDVPTISEAGMPQFKLTSWAALFGPAKMPREIVERLNKEFAAAMTKPEVRAAMEKQAFLLQSSTPEQLGTLVRDQLEAFKSTMKLAGIEPE
jgi:tripartite-type tricarboxylate transporter receptor subunit TctC